MLVQVGFLGLKDGDGRLSLLVLGLLRLMVPAHLLLRSASNIIADQSGDRLGYLPAHILSQRLSDLISLLGQLLLKFDLLTAEGLDLFLVEVELLLQGLARLLQAVDLALQRRIVRVGLRLAHVGSHRCHLHLIKSPRFVNMIDE